MATEEAAPNPNEAQAPPKASIPIVPLLNTIAILAAGGFLYYSKFLHKRPPITESGERKRIAETKASPAPPAIPVLVPFESMTVNIKAIPEVPKPADGTSKQIHGKLHYATIAFAMQIRDQNQKDFFDNLKPFILDRICLLYTSDAADEL